jgi:hypothetical protein
MDFLAQRKDRIQKKRGIQKKKKKKKKKELKLQMREDQCDV